MYWLAIKKVYVSSICHLVYEYTVNTESTVEILTLLTRYVVGMAGFWEEVLRSFCPSPNIFHFRWKFMHLPNTQYIKVKISHY
jgi:hypothetical protein